jgi:hypothetical protein
MSTAGKVLTVLIMLVMVAWLVMMSAVTQLNVSYGQKIKNQETDLEKVTADALKTTTDYLDVTEKARREQDLTEREVRIKLGEIAIAERRRSTKTEDLTRVKTQLADYEIAAVKAKANLDNREAEKIKDEELLAKKREEIDKLKAVNAEYKAQLAQLQEEFKKILAENAAKVKTPGSKPVQGINEGPSS